MVIGKTGEGRDGRGEQERRDESQEGHRDRYQRVLEVYMDPQCLNLPNPVGVPFQGEVPCLVRWPFQEGV